MNTDQLNKISERIINAAYKVSNTLGAGFLEKVYENALAHQLRKDGMKIEQQKPIKVYYDNIIAEGSVIVELKSAKNIGILHIGIKVVYTFLRMFLRQTYRVNQSALSLCGYFKEKLFGRSKKIGIFFFYYIKEKFDPVLFLFLARQYFHRRPVFSFAIVITPMVVIKHNQVQSFLRDMVL